MNISDETRFAIEDLIKKVIEEGLIEKLIGEKIKLLASTRQQMDSIDLGIRLVADSLEKIRDSISAVAEAMEDTK